MQVSKTLFGLKISEDQKLRNSPGSNILFDFFPYIKNIPLTSSSMINAHSHITFHPTESMQLKVLYPQSESLGLLKVCRSRKFLARPWLPSLLQRLKNILNQMVKKKKNIFTPSPTKKFILNH